MSQENTKLLYDIIYDFIAQNKIEVGEIISIFEQIKFEQLCEANNVHCECDEDEDED